MRGRTSLVALPPPTTSEALLALFRATMAFYVEHRDVSMPRLVTATLISLKEAADHPEIAQRAVLKVGAAIIRHSSAKGDQAVINALRLSHSLLKVDLP